MEVSKGNILFLLNGDKQFIVPVYQRIYSWEREQCKRLWNDMINVRTNVIKSHFIGSIVNISEIATPSGVSKFMIIDGQQRFTTITIILIALRNYLIKNDDKSSINYKKIEASYLINTYETGECKYKLLLTQSDKETLFKLIDNENDENTNLSKRIIDNYNFFYNKILSGEISPDEIFEILNKLTIVNITLDRDFDNPQLIFESLNSTGLNLSQSDLIRNFMLMGLTPFEQDYIYKKFWFPMEQKFKYDKRTYLMDKFIRDFLTIKLGHIPSSSMVYEEFKTYRYHKIGMSIRDIAKEIYKYSKYYTNIIYSLSDDNELNKIFSDIKDLQSEVIYPFLMVVYDDYENNKILRNEFIEILLLCESYVFRRTICGIPTNSMNKTFSTLKNFINYDNYVESIKAKMVLMDSYKRFPDNEEFIKELEIKDIFNMRIKNYMFLKLENYNNKAPINIQNYTVEHIMPQNPKLSEDWQKNLGENWREIQKKYLHTLGNLTLTAYNSEMSDKDFSEKNNMKRGYKESALYINRDVIQLEYWNEETILNRSRNLSRLAEEIWQYPYLSDNLLEKYKSKNEEQIYSLDDYDYLHDQILELFTDLDSAVNSEFPNSKMELRKHYIVYKKEGISFLSIIPQKNRLSLVLNIKFDDIFDPKEMCRDITNKGKWGTGDVRVFFSKEEQLNYIIELIRQAYDKL